MRTEHAYVFDLTDEISKSKIPPLNFTIDAKGTVFIRTGGTSGYDYVIEHDRIDTPLKALAWAAHLAEKTWWSPWQCQQLIYGLAHKYHWDMML